MWTGFRITPKVERRGGANKENKSKNAPGEKSLADHSRGHAVGYTNYVSIPFLMDKSILRRGEIEDFKRILH
jgi:hypothetical protein